MEELTEETIDKLKRRNKVIDKSILIYIKKLYRRSKRSNYCGVGQGLVGISKTGDVYPCHRFVGHEDMRMGNVNTAKIFNKEFSLNNKGILSTTCKTCWARYFCGGGCIYESLQANDSLYVPDEKWCLKLKKSVELGIYAYDKLNIDDKKYLGFIKNEPKNRLP